MKGGMERSWIVVHGQQVPFGKAVRFDALIRRGDTWLPSIVATEREKTGAKAGSVKKRP